MARDEPFLHESRFCDYSHPAIREVADSFRARCPGQRELAVGLFYRVRDGVKYEVGNWQRTASETLERGYGACTNSANLLVALLRACGIPAGYGVMTVLGREYFGPITPPRLAQFASEISKHVYAYAWLGGAWTRCDPSDDIGLSRASQHLNPQCEIVEWDGFGHANLNLDPDHIVEDLGPLADIDAFMDKRMRRVLQIPVRIGNAYIEFLRREGLRFAEPAEAVAAFEHWLRADSPLLYRIYRLAPVPRDPARADAAPAEQTPVL